MLIISVQNYKFEMFYRSQWVLGQFVEYSSCSLRHAISILPPPIKKKKKCFMEKKHGEKNIS